MGENLRGEESAKARGLQDMAATIGSVVHAAQEQGVESDTPLLELPSEVFERADEIYQATKPE